MTIFLACVAIPHITRRHLNMYCHLPIAWVCLYFSASRQQWWMDGGKQISGHNAMRNRHVNRLNRLGKLKYKAKVCNYGKCGKMPVRESCCDKGKAGHFQNIVVAVDKHSLCTCFVHTTGGWLFANLHFIFLFSQLAWSSVHSSRIIYIDLNFNPHHINLLYRRGGVPINNNLTNS